MARILIIDDDTRLTSMLIDYLGQHALRSEARGSARDGLAALRHEAFDALILDVMLPDGDGLDVCREIRTQSAIPILMLTGRGEETDRVVGLELGADDYLPKPFSPRELLARLRAMLRRGQGALQAGPPPLVFGQLEIERGGRRR